MFKSSFGALCLVPLMMASTAWADWKDEYRSFQKAMAAGDSAGMKQHAGAAWEQSRATLPPSENRAALAQNYLTLILFDDPEAAVVVTDDLTELAKGGFGTSTLSLETVVFLNQFSRSQAAPKHRQKARRAAAAAVKVPARDLAVDDVILAQQFLARRQIGLEQAAEVRPYLDRLSARLLELPQMDARSFQNLEALRMIGTVSNVPRVDRAESRLSVTKQQEVFIEDMQLLVRNFRMLINKYGIQDSIETFNSDLAEAMAWEDLALSYLYGWDSSVNVDMFLADLPSMKSGIGRPSGCGSFELTQNNVTFPASANNYNGAVLVGYHLDDEGKVYGERILSEIPSRRFGDHLLKQVSKFRADVSGLNVQCSENHLYAVSFYIRPPK